MSDYMKSGLKPTGVETLEDLIKLDDFITYCSQFNTPMMTDFRDKVESYVYHRIKSANKNTNINE